MITTDILYSFTNNTDANKHACIVYQQQKKDYLSKNFFRIFV